MFVANAGGKGLIHVKVVGEKDQNDAYDALKRDM